MLLAAYEELNATRRTSAGRMQDTARVLAELYTAADQSEKAAVWKRRAAGLPDSGSATPAAAPAPKP